MKIQKLILFIKMVYKNYKEDDVPVLSAYFTYNLILSIFPFLVFLIAVLTFTPLTSKQAMSYLESFFPVQAYQIIDTTISEVIKSNRVGFISLGMIAAIWVASNGFIAMVKGMNKAYNVEETRSFIKLRGLSILFTFSFSILIIIYLLVVIFGSVWMEFIPVSWKLSWELSLMRGAIQYIVPMMLTFIISLCTYHFIPNCNCTWKKIFPGAVFCSVSLFLTSNLFSIYISHFGNFAQIYGSIGGIIILLIWLNLTSTILLIGGEFNASLDEINALRNETGSMWEGNSIQ